MKIRFRSICGGFLVAVIGILATVPAAAESGDSGFYVSARALGAYSRITDSSHGGTVAGATLRESEHDDLVAGAGLAFGYSFAADTRWPVRTELEVIHRFRFDYDARATGGGSSFGFRNDVATQTVMFNVLWDFWSQRRLRPFVGVGLGWYRHDNDAAQTNLTTGVTVGKETETTGLAWSGLAGLNYDISPLWGVEFYYRYIDMGQVESGPYPNGNKLTGDYSSHDFVIGVSYRF